MTNLIICILIRRTSYSLAPVVTVLEVLSATSVKVSWELLDIPEITGYIVHYSQTGDITIEQSMNVTNTTSFVVITDLTSNVQYQFEVVAVAELDEEVVIGERSVELVTVTPTASATKRWLKSKSNFTF